MTRPYHSPSSTELGRRCLRAWAYAYVDGLRDPEVQWTEEMAGHLPAGVTPRQRSAALGSAVHSVIERWYLEGGAAPWLTYPGKVAESGRHLLPTPGAAAVHVEQPIGAVPIVGGNPDGPRVGYRVDGVTWAGFRDLVAVGAIELARLKIRAPAGVALFDHKTTSSIGRYAKSSDDLAGDLQCNLYALATMSEHGVDQLPARWIYYETKAVRRALPVDVLIFRSRAEDVVGKAGELTRTLDAIERSVDAPQNVNACGDYGGCPYHVTAGGPCDARRAVGRLIKIGKGRSMALTDEQKAKFAAFRKTPAPAEVDLGGEVAAESGEAEAEAAAPSGQLPLPHVNGANGAAPVAAAPAAPRPRGRPRKTPAPAAASPVPVVIATGGLAEVIGKAQAEIAEAEQAIAQATARRDEAVNALRAALG